MEPSELRVAQIAQQVGAVGLQASKAYNDAQGSLELDLVLTPKRLATAEGTEESLRVLACLYELTSAHAEMFAKFVTTAAGHLTAAVCELPADRAAEYRDGMVASIQWNLTAQANFYRNREKWIAAATGICELVRSQRESITFTDDTVVFSNDEALATFEHLVSAADGIHHLEVAATDERLARLARSMATLNAAAS